MSNLNSVTTSIT